MRMGRGLVAVLLVVLSLAYGQEELPQGGVVNIPLATQPGSFNPILPSELAAAIINWTMFSPLTVQNPETQELEPYLAESWNVTDDLMTWTFELHPDAVWHDGVPVTANDVKFTFDRIRDETEGATTFADFERVSEVVVVDEHTLRVELSEPDSYFADRLALGGNEIIPEHILGSFESLSDATEFNTRTPVGSGPFKMKTVVTGSYFELEANENFFLGRPNLDSLIFRVVPDGNNRVTQLQTGNLDWVDLEPVQLNAIRNNPNFEIHTYDSLGYQLFAWNLRNELFQDPLVRRAMTHAIDRRAMIETVSPGLGYIDDIFIPSSFEWIQRPDVTFREYDPELARQLLTEAGWQDTDGDGVLDKDGQPFAFYILVDQGDVQREQMGLIIQQYLQDVGMDVDYVLAERGGRWLEETQDGTFPTRLAAFPLPSVDWAWRLYTTDAPFNSQAYSNADVDALFEQVAQTSDREQQGAFLTEAQAVMYEDPPVMPLLYRERMTASNVRVGNVPNADIKVSMPFVHNLYIKP